MSKILLVLLIFLAACAPWEEENNKPNESGNKNTGIKTVLTNLHSPWDIEESHGIFYITEREGTIVKWEEGEQKKREVVHTDKPITQKGEGGLLGFKLLPDFPENKVALAYHTYQDGDTTLNRLVVLTLEGETWKETDVLLERIPGAQFHNGGRIELGPDHKIYVTTGDSLNKDLAQNKQSLAGKILRLNRDGSVPKDNPFPDSYIYSYGHRNPQGLTWNEDGTLFAAEHGSDQHDEVNIITPGSNYGWPIIRGKEEKKGMETPLFETGKNTWAPSGLAAYKGDLFIATLRGKSLQKLSFTGSNPEMVMNQFGRLRDVEIVGDDLYIITNNTDGRGSPGAQDDKLLKWRR
ncbi:PQQ-dependent sugar dehydrogenase [Halobacillus rhizosphaerae]|uniref:PQQ-dependent sugar dehydrogenase n=1 Tax=Halobacillus rhizosphaerae TaxID=3064889 RepID=UPI00398B0652